MAIITDITGDWSDDLTLTDDEFWQIRRGPIYLATAAGTAPAEDDDGLLLSEGDVIALEAGEVVRYRSAKAAGGAKIVRRARA